MSRRGDVVATQPSGLGERGAKTQAQNQVVITRRAQLGEHVLDQVLVGERELARDVDGVTHARASLGTSDPIAPCSATV